MDAPYFIFAEAILKPKPGGKSIIDPDAQITAETVKQFNADPVLVKQAVLQLKKAGFSVGAVGKVSIGISASKELFETTFGKKITQTEVGIVWEGSSDYGFLAAENTGFAGVLSGVSIEQGASGKSCQERVKNDTQFCPDKLVEKLGADNAYIEKFSIKNDKNPRVAVIDTGFYKHEYFKEYPNLEVKVKLAESEINQAMDLYDRTVAETEKLKKSLEIIFKTMQQLPKLLDPKVRKSAESEITRLIDSGLEWFQPEFEDAIKSGISQDKIEVMLRGLEDTEKGIQDKKNNLEEILNPIREYVNKESDKRGHGTQVLSNFVPIAPRIQVILYKSLALNKPNDPVNSSPEKQSVIGCFKDAITKKPNIISCSMGYSLNKEVWKKKDAGEEEKARLNALHKGYGPLIFWIKNAILSGITVVYASGNDDEESKGMIDLEAHIENAIVVGGAFKDTNSVVTASDFAHGYSGTLFKGPPRIIPDICGWCGPKISDVNTQYNMWVPKKVDKTDTYELNQGTSLATPQVAAVCALIKQVYPGATPDVIKKIIMATVDEITAGKSAQKEELHNLPKKDFDFGDGIIRTKGIGLVNIKAAVDLALQLSAKAAASQQKN